MRRVCRLGLGRARRPAGRSGLVTADGRAGLARATVGSIMSTSFAEPVLAWYARNARDLPWRAPGVTPWAVLVSEIMLQQTPVARVLPEYLSWMTRWPTPAALAAAPAGEAIRQWGRLGYPRRALRLHETATILTARHGGTVPAALDALRALPGIGSYPAAAGGRFPLRPPAPPSARTPPAGPGPR